MVGPAIPALVLLPILLVSVLSSSMLVGGFLEAIWRWSLKPTFNLMLNTVLFLLGLVTLPLSFVRLVVLRFGHPLVRTLHSFRSLRQGVLSYRSCYESCPPIGKRGYRSKSSSFVAVRVQRVTRRSFNSPIISLLLFC